MAVWKTPTVNGFPVGLRSTHRCFVGIFLLSAIWNWLFLGHLYHEVPKVKVLFMDRQEMRRSFGNPRVVNKAL